jgi:hypothetical protein
LARGLLNGLTVRLFGRVLTALVPGLGWLTTGAGPEAFARLGRMELKWLDSCPWACAGQRGADQRAVPTTNARAEPADTMRLILIMVRPPGRDPQATGAATDPLG